MWIKTSIYQSRLRRSPRSVQHMRRHPRKNCNSPVFEVLSLLINHRRYRLHPHTRPILSLSPTARMVTTAMVSWKIYTTTTAWASPNGTARPKMVLHTSCSIPQQHILGLRSKALYGMALTPRIWVEWVALGKRTGRQPLQALRLQLSLPELSLTREPLGLLHTEKRWRSAVVLMVYSFSSLGHLRVSL